MTEKRTHSSAGSGPVKNTDREIYHTPFNSVHDDSIHVTQGGGIGINVAGNVIVKPLRGWHALASIPTDAQSVGMTVESVAAIIDPVAFDPISLSDKHPGWECRREQATETARKIVALASQPSPAAIGRVDREGGWNAGRDIGHEHLSAANASDLLERLRMKAKPHETIAVFVALCQEAAAQIEEQRKQLNWAQGEIDRLLNEPQAVSEPVAYRWRTLPQFSEDPEDQEWSLIPNKPNFINPHHHEVEPLHSGREHPDGPWVSISALSRPQSQRDEASPGMSSQESR